MRFAVQLDLTEPIVAYQGGLIRAMPAASRIARWEGRPDEGVPPVGRLLRHRPLPGAVARDAVEWSRAHGLDPHANHLERFILRADDPRAEDYSAFMGAQAELVPDLAAAMTHPITKVLSVSEAPVPVSLLEAARRDFAGRADVTISHPRFLEFIAPGVSKGRGPRRGSRGELVSRCRGRWRSAISGTTSRCCGRRAMAWRCPARRQRSGRPRAISRRP